MNEESNAEMLFLLALFFSLSKRSRVFGGTTKNLDSFGCGLIWSEWSTLMVWWKIEYGLWRRVPPKHPGDGELGQVEVGWSELLELGMLYGQGYSVGPAEKNLQFCWILKWMLKVESR